MPGLIMRQLLCDPVCLLSESLTVLLAEPAELGASSLAHTDCACDSIACSQNALLAWR